MMHPETGNLIIGSVYAQAKESLDRYGHMSVDMIPNTKVTRPVLARDALSGMADGSISPMTREEFGEYWKTQTFAPGLLGSFVGDVWKSISGAATTVWHSVSGAAVSALQFVGRNTTDALNAVSHALDQIPVVGNILAAPLKLVSHEITQPLNIQGSLDATLGSISKGLNEIPYVGSIIDLPIAMTQDVIDKTIQLSPLTLVADAASGNIGKWTGGFAPNNLLKMPKTGQDIIAIDKIPYIGPLILPVGIAALGVATGGFGIAGLLPEIGITGTSASILGAGAADIIETVANKALSNQITQYAKGKQAEALSQAETSLTQKLAPTRRQIDAAWSSLKSQTDPFMSQAVLAANKMLSLSPTDATLQNDNAKILSDNQTYQSLSTRLVSMLSNAKSLESGLHGRQEMIALKTSIDLLSQIMDSKTNTGIVLTTKADLLTMQSDTKSSLMKKSAPVTGTVLASAMKGSPVSQSAVNSMVAQNLRSPVSVSLSPVVASAVTNGTQSFNASLKTKASVQARSMKKTSSYGSLIAAVGAALILL